MSSLGQISTRLDHRLQVVGDLTKALLALRADLTGKLDVLKLKAEDVDKARATIIDFLNGLILALNGQTPTPEEHQIVLTKLEQTEVPLADWVEDFSKVIGKLQASTQVESAQLDKVIRVVGFLQGEAAEDVRRLRSR
jgi:hypothetical protein